MRERWTAIPVVFLALAALSPPAAATEAPGQRLQLQPQDLPPPYASSSATNRPDTVERPDGLLPSAPPGFSVTLFAGGLDDPRGLAVAPDGAVFLAEQSADQITRLVDADGDGVAEQATTFLEDLEEPFGLAFRDGFLYFADVEAVWRVPYGGEAEAAAEPAQVTPEGTLGDSSGHSTRNIAFHPDGTRLYVAIGSAGNIGEEPEPRATIQVFDLAADGSRTEGQRTFAAGLRNPVGLAFYPGTERLFTVVNERDGLGDELVPDYLTEVAEGAFYGWPYAYIGANPQPDYAEERPDLVEKTVVPDLLFRSHSAPIGLVFYEGEFPGGDAFPEDYRGDAFVALRGSWNAASPRGYMVVRVPFADSKPEGWYETFLTGFRLDSQAQGQAEVWGRPAGLAVAADGSLLVADDTSGSIWRVAREE